MKTLFFILFVVLALNGFSQTDFDINFNRSAIASSVNVENDSLFNDKVEIKIFETNSVSSVELKFFTFSDSTFTEVVNSTTTISSISSTPCESDYCLYKLNPSVVIINLGTHLALGPKHKVYIKINGAAGKGNLIKEVEL